MSRTDSDLAESTLISCAKKKRKHSEVADQQNEIVQTKNATDEPNNEYEVEKILDCRWSEAGQCLQYLIKWRGYDDSQNTWESECNLEGCKSTVLRYHREHSAAKALSKFSQFYVRDSARRRKFQNDDELDEELFNALGPKFPYSRWNVAKIGKGCYTVKVNNDRTSTATGDKIVPSKKLPPLQLREVKATTPKNTNNATDVIPALTTSSTSLLSSSASPSLSKLQKWAQEVDQISLAAGEAPVRVENDVDDSCPTVDGFVYVTSLQAGQGVFIPSEPIVGCECATATANKSGGGDLSCRSNHTQCCAAQMFADFAYTKTGTLQLHQGRPIYECNALCKCGTGCVNRVVQKGRQIPLIIFKTNDGRGWGVKTTTYIKKNTFVVEYVGEVLTTESADERADVSYMFNMDFSGTAKYVIDAKHYGNASRFINHSCEPNLVVYSVWIEHYEAALPRLAFFTKQAVEAGEELTFNYMRENGQADTSMTSNVSEEESESVGANSQRSKSNSRRQHRVPCKCKSATCQGNKFPTSD